MRPMSVGEVFNRANVTIGGTLYKGLRAVIYDDKGRLTNPDGSEVAVMNGPIDISEVSEDGAIWSNGTDTWEIKKAGCACRGG